MAAHGRRPSKHTDDGAERSLGVWLSNVRHRALTADRVALLDVLVPGWRDTRVSESVFTAKVTGYAGFVTGHGHCPREDGPDTAERRLARWLSDVRRGKARPTADRAALLDDRIPRLARRARLTGRDLGFEPAPAPADEPSGPAADQDPGRAAR